MPDQLGANTGTLVFRCHVYVLQQSAPACVMVAKCAGQAHYCVVDLRHSYVLVGSGCAEPLLPQGSAVAQQVAIQVGIAEHAPVGEAPVSRVQARYGLEIGGSGFTYLHGAATVNTIADFQAVWALRRR